VSGCAAPTLRHDHHRLGRRQVASRRAAQVRARYHDRDCNLRAEQAWNETYYLGLVVAKRGSSVLTQSQVEGRPSVNDLATLLAQAMRRPLTGGAHRPRRLHVRRHPQWRELFPHPEALGIDVLVRRELPKVKDAYENHLRQLREARRARVVKPTTEQATVEQMFPAIAQWVRGCGHIEIGDQEMVGFVVRALDYGGMVFEDNMPDTLAEAMVALEKGLTEWFKAEGIPIG
jgi:hypothetical protein